MTLCGLEFEAWQVEVLHQVDKHGDLPPSVQAGAMPEGVAVADIDDGWTFSRRRRDEPST